MGEKEPLAQQVLARAGFPARDVGARHEVAPQQRSQAQRVEPVGLDLRVGDEPGLERVRQHDLLDFVDLFEQVVREVPIPARLQNRLARPLQALEELNEAGRGIALNASLPQFPAPFVLCDKDTVALVNVDSNVIHGSFLLSVFRFALRYRHCGLLSCYLTPFPLTVC